MNDDETTQDEQITEAPELPRSDFAVRGLYAAEGVERAVALRDGEDDARPVMFGYLSLFGERAHIDSRIEGQFIESVEPGAFKKTIKENRSRMRVIYDHGQDTRFGRHPLGPIQELREDERGAYYEVPLLDTSYNKDLLPGLRAGVYGTSYKFRPTKLERSTPRTATEDNPDRWEERRILELEMVEFGPTPFPVYAGPSAGIRSLTDEYRINQLGIDPEQLRALLTSIALPTEEPAPATPPVASRTVPAVQRFRSREDYIAWLTGR